MASSLIRLFWSQYPATVTKRGESKGMHTYPKANFNRGVKREAIGTQAEWSGNGHQKRRIKGEAIGTQEEGSGNGDQKRRIKGEAIGTQEEGSGNGDQKRRIKGEA